MKTYKKTWMLPILSLLLCGSAYAFTAPAADTSGKKDAGFAKKAAAGGMFEVEAAELAKENGESQAVKDFAEMMIKDHTSVNEKLKGIAADKNIELPASLPEDKASKLETLSTLSGAAFDKAYAEEMVSSHEKTIALFEEEAESGEDPDLSGLAEESLPTLRHHLAEAEALKGEAGE
ncbi:putative membrane protein [Anseongella ginsenosidimutans]|uniref:Putative membrane protein n=1 Tax=Anseongella ginsenosidimutans TaxID=496056 RepID=A0A4R3KRG0_9SPHI|nr:DUF4142 domain-containing protein [Anseongella ginsenosidimutans]QEC52874.1 DUF4142 domain-containing protein [Anseongella ginsenosidimutans]TCS87264.1 putative membrane protein [Anseongella ginsenosidimutans]